MSDTEHPIKWNYSSSPSERCSLWECPKDNGLLGRNLKYSINSIIVIGVPPSVEESQCRVGIILAWGISFACGQDRFFFVYFLLLALNYEKLGETGKEE